jgi:hypothetical protein
MTLAAPWSSCLSTGESDVCETPIPDRTTPAANIALSIPSQYCLPDALAATPLNSRFRAGPRQTCADIFDLLSRRFANDDSQHRLMHIDAGHAAIHWLHIYLLGIVAPEDQYD